jgi:hypothetical protein
MKYEYRKHEKGIYGVGSTPDVVDIPVQKFICIGGNGNPNDEQFQKNVEVLYQVTYAIKMKFKGIEGYFDYTVYPLEGLWTLTDKGKFIQQNTGKVDKNEFSYRIMIKQPSFVTNEVFVQAVELSKEKKSSNLLDKITFEEVSEGLSAQVLHTGSYDDEPASFETLDCFLKDNGYRKTSPAHKEIYLSDARKTPAKKLKTILRVAIEKDGDEDRDKMTNERPSEDVQDEHLNRTKAFAE